MKTGYVMLMVLVLAVAPVRALKVKVFTLKELVDSADMIVAATMAFEDGEPYAKIREIIKGAGRETDVKIRAASLQPDNAMRFADGEDVVLFLESAGTDGTRELIGYGDQGKWPKRTEKWPYTAAHTSSVERVETIVTGLVRLHDNKAGAESFLRGLLHSGQAFDQVVALECLESFACTKLWNALQTDVDKIAESTNTVLKQKALYVRECNSRERSTRASK